MKNLIFPLALLSATSLTITAAETWLAAATITVSTPAVSIVITTQGPAVNDILTSREDWPYTVTNTITQLSTAPDASASQKAVDLFHYGLPYTSAPNVENASPGPKIKLSEVLSAVPTTGSTLVFNPTRSSLEPGPLGHVNGEHFYSAFTVPEAGVEILLLDEKKLRMFPKLNGELNFVGGTSSGGSLIFPLSQVPDLEVTTYNKYPDSVHFVQIYEGQSKVGVALRGDIVGNPKKNSSKTPTISQTDKISSMSEHIKKPIRYTLELMSLTPVLPAANFTTVGFASLGQVEGGGGIVVKLSAVEALKYGVDTAGSYLLERGKNNNPLTAGDEEPTPYLDNVIINAIITTDQ
jgi:hypothetical protein